MLVISNWQKFIFLLWYSVVILQNVDSLLLEFLQSGRRSSFQYGNEKVTIRMGEKEKCMPDLGCFSAGSPFFDAVHRPLSLLPQDREEVATAFLLYTRDNPYFFQFLRVPETETVERSNYRAEDQTKIIVPGWMDNLKVSNWMQDMKDALLHYDDCNVIIVDWSKTNGIPFAAAVANSRVVGAEIALLVNFLQDHYDARPEDFHIIGHSLGTEIAGYAGERINNLGRITALDPAGPYFRNVPPEVRLDPSDAIFVDAIHAHSSDQDLESPSRMQQTGHIDFYPNGGESQPGCPSDVIDTFNKKGIIGGARNLLVCDHYRVIDYFMATIPNHYGSKPIGVACDSWTSFVSGRCADCGPDGSLCAVMGFQSDEKQELIKRHPPRKYYLYTSRRPPFSVQQYHISLKLGTLGSQVGMIGQLYVTLLGKHGNVTSNINQNNGLLTPGTVYTTVITTEQDISVKTLVFSWSCASLKLGENVRINFAKTTGCQLYLHSIIVTAYKDEISKSNQLISCGPKTMIPPDFDLFLSDYSFC